MLLAIDLPELRDIRNTLMFSQKGSRPEPNKMAGSDLDGDEYAVTWDNRLFLNEWNKCTVEGNSAATTKMRSSTKRINFSNAKQAARELSLANASPLEYLRPPMADSSELSDEGNLTKLLIDHFFECNRLDVIGLIGMLWQDYAARSGAGCSKCTHLAELHSVAVDYAKSGVPAVVPRELKLSGRCPRYETFNLRASDPILYLSFLSQLYYFSLWIYTERIGVKRSMSLLFTAIASLVNSMTRLLVPLNATNWRLQNMSHKFHLHSLAANLISMARYSASWRPDKI